MDIITLGVMVRNHKENFLYNNGCYLEHILSGTWKCTLCSPCRSFKIGNVRRYVCLWI